MAGTLHYYGNKQIGDQCVRFWTVVRRGVSPLIQSGVSRESAILSDLSPNLYYELHVVITETRGDPVDLQMWVVTIGDLIKPGRTQSGEPKPRDARVTLESGKSLIMPEAILADPIQAPPNDGQNPMKTLNMELVYVSQLRPYAG